MKVVGFYRSSSLLPSPPPPLAGRPDHSQHGVQSQGAVFNCNCQMPREGTNKQKESDGNLREEMDLKMQKLKKNQLGSVCTRVQLQRRGVGNVVFFNGLNRYISTARVTI